MKNQKIFYFLRIFPYFFIIFDHLLAKEIQLTLNNELRVIFHKRPDVILKILKKYIRTGRESFKKKRDEKGATIQLLADHFLKIHAKKICIPKRLLESTQESICGMEGNPDAYDTDRISFLFRKRKEAQEKIFLADKNFKKYWFLVKACGLKTWPDRVGYIAQQLPRL